MIHKFKVVLFIAAACFAAWAALEIREDVIRALDRLRHPKEDLIEKHLLDSTKSLDEADKLLRELIRKTEPKAPII